LVRFSFEMQALATGLMVTEVRIVADYKGVQITVRNLHKVQCSVCLIYMYCYYGFSL